jgi:hypothetical protein
MTRKIQGLYSGVSSHYARDGSGRLAVFNEEKNRLTLFADLYENLNGSFEKAAASAVNLAQCNPGLAVRVRASFESAPVPAGKEEDVRTVAARLKDSVPPPRR